MRLNLRSEGGKRTLTGAAIVVGLVTAFAFRLLTVWVFDAFLLGIIVFAVYDIAKAKKIAERGVKIHYIYAYLFVAYLTFLLGLVVATPFSLWLHVVVQFLILAVFAVYVWIMNLADKDFARQAALNKLNPQKECRKSALEFIKVAIYPTLMLLSLVVLNHLGQFAKYWIDDGKTSASVDVGFFSLLLVFVISSFSDTAGYLTGKILKPKKKLAPKISPKKTVAGAVGCLFGGMIGALLVVLVCSSSTALSEFLTQKIGGSVVVQLLFIAVGLVGSIATQIGDLYASWIKRRAGIKDYGNYLPGHGGAMDRVDGLCWNAVFIFFVMMLIVFI